MPLVITDEQLDEALDVIEAALVQARQEDSSSCADADVLVHGSNT